MIDKTNSWDNCKSLTKEELILFLKNELWLHAPKARDVDLFKYFFNSKKILKEIDDFHIKYHPIRQSMAGEYDALAKRYNESDDLIEKGNLLKEMSAILTKVKSINAKEDLLDKALERNEKWWDKHNKQEKQL